MDRQADIIKVHPHDNVGVVISAQGLPKGFMLADGTVLVEEIPFAHKAALCDIEADQPVIRYGQIIGYAHSRLPRGSWVDETKVALPEPPDLDEMLRRYQQHSRDSEVTALPPRHAPGMEKGLSERQFLAFRNEDGSVGSRNLLGLVTSVQCAAAVVQHAARRIETELLPRYPSVDGVVVLNHGYGCGVAINAPNADIPIRTLQHLAQHPNFGGQAIIIGLGCEKLKPETLAECSGCRADPSVIRLQEEQGFEAMIARIMRVAEQRLAILNRRQRIPVPLSELVVGLQCGGSDALSGLTANPAMGYAADLLVEAGATVMFSEVTEVRDAMHLLVPRAATYEVAEALVREMKWYDAYLAAGGADRAANPTPGNKKGGLSNIVEKALGSAVKSGTSPIVGVISPGERLPAAPRGLYFAATPASDFLCGTLQLAAGMHVEVFSTGRGTPYGLAMAPVIKVSSNSELPRAWPDLIDIDAGRIACGTATIEQVGSEIAHFIIDTASGLSQPHTERLRLFNEIVLFNPAPVT